MGKLSKPNFYDIIKVDKGRVEELLYQGGELELTEWEQGFLEDCLQNLEKGRELREVQREKLLEIEEGE